MANDVVSQSPDARASRMLRMWVYGLSASAAGMLISGALLATAVDGPARPWAGLGLVISMALAIVVGMSKTSSA